MANLPESVPATHERPLHPADVALTSRGRAAPEPVANDLAPGDSAWDLGTKRTVIVILLIAVVGVIQASRPIIPMLVVAGVIAYFLSPIVDLAGRIHIPRTITTIVLYLLLLIGIVLTPVLLAPVLLSQLASLNFDVPTTAFRLFAWLGTTISTLPDTLDLFGFTVQVSGITQQIEQSYRNFAFIPTLAEILSYFQQLISTATNVVGSTAAIGVSVVGGIVQAFIAILLVFFLSLYLTKDAPDIRAYIEGLFPRSYQSEWIDLLRRMGYIWQAFFRGKILLSLVVGTVTWLALELAGMPGALILGIVAGVLEIVPNLGPTLAMVPAVIVALIQGSPVLVEYGVNNFGFALITVAIYFIIQQLENYILVPRIIGDGVNLHPIVVLCGVAIGFNVAGVLGALFAAPVIASLRVLGGYIHAKLLDYPPFQQPALQAGAPWTRPRPSAVYRRTVTGEELAARTVGRRHAAAAAGTHPAETAVAEPAAGEPPVTVVAEITQEITPRAVNELRNGDYHAGSRLPESSAESVSKDVNN